MILDRLSKTDFHIDLKEAVSQDSTKNSNNDSKKAFTNDSEFDDINALINHA